MSRSISRTTHQCVMTEVNKDTTGPPPPPALLNPVCSIPSTVKRILKHQIAACVPDGPELLLKINSYTHSFCSYKERERKREREKRRKD